MNGMDWPALTSLKPTQRLPELRLERGIWGKVDGQRSDYRWIARSEGFRGHRSSLETALRVGRENSPADFPIWRCHKGRYYAARCYPSRSRDAVGRSGFLEKHILEWEPEGELANIPVASALVMLLNLDGLDDSDWFSQANDPRWSNDNFYLPIESRKIPVDAQIVSKAVSQGLGYWRNRCSGAFPFYKGIEIGARHIALGGFMEPPKGPALGTLLLPIRESDPIQLSMSGWIPSDNHEGVEENWSVVFGPRQAKNDQFFSLDAQLRAESLATSDPELLRPGSPTLRDILEFAKGSSRWLSAKKTWVAADASSSERRILEIAIRSAHDRAAAVHDEDNELEQARRKHLSYKANVIEAACELCFKIEHTSDRASEILNYWRQKHT